MTGPGISYYRHLGGPWYWTILVSINTGRCPIHRRDLHAAPGGDGYCTACQGYWYWDPAAQSVHFRGGEDEG